MQRLSYICKTMIIVIGAIHLIAPVLPVNVLPITFFLGLGVLLTALPLMEKTFKRASLVFFCAGLVLLLLDKQPFPIWVAGVNSMLIVSSIVVIMQLFSIPIDAGGYQAALEYLLLKRVKNEGALFLFTTIVTHLFSSFLLMGTIPVMFSLLGDVLKRRVTSYERFMATALSRGFTMVVLWAPGAVNILLVLEVTGVKWVDVFVPGLVLSAIGIVTSYLLESKYHLMPEGKRLSDGEYTNGFISPRDRSGQTAAQEADAWKKAGVIISVVIALILLPVLLERFHISNSSVHRILLSGTFIVFIWISFYYKNPNLGKAVKSYWESGVNKAVDVAGLFVAMGFFSEALDKSRFFMLLRLYLPSYVESMALYLPVIVPLVIILFALFGIHPFISIVLSGKILTSINLPISHLVLALALSLGGAVAYIVSPFAGTILILSKYINRRPLEIVLKWNGVFCLFYFLEAIVFIYLASMLI